MELPPFDKVSNIWAPDFEELFEFCRKNRYVREMNNEFFIEEQRKENMQIAKIQSPETQLLLASYEGVSIHAFLYTLTKKSNVYYTPDGRPSGIRFMEEEAIVLCRMLRREGFFEEVTDEPGCTVCATEKLEKNMMDIMQRQLDVTRMAREYYTLPENAHRYNICANHLPFDPKNCVPNVNGVRGGPHRASTVSATYTGPQVNSQNVRPQQINPEVAPEYTHGRNAIYDPVPIQQGGQTLPPSAIQAFNFNTLEYIANEMGVRPKNCAELPPQFGTQASPADLIPNPFAGEAMNNLFPNNFIDPACQLQFLPDSKFFPKDLNARGSAQADSFEKETNNLFHANRSNARFVAAAQTSGPNRRNVGVNISSFQEAGPSTSTPYGENNMPQHLAAGANNIVHRSLSMNQVSNFVNLGINPRMNPARQQLINNAVNNVARDLQDELLRSNRIGRKIVGKRY